MCFKVLASSVAVLAASASFATSFTQNFDDIGGTTTNGQSAGANLEALGWFLLNDSTNLGPEDWFQGNATIPALSGGYIATNFFAGSSTGQISNWMMLPTATLNNGDTLTFFTRTATHDFSDRLQVRLSTSGNSTAASAFSTVLLDINPTELQTGYPLAWTQFTVTLSGLTGPTSGRLALRYFAQDITTSGNFIGIDTLSYQAVPEPTTMALLGLGAAAMLKRRKK